MRLPDEDQEGVAALCSRAPPAGQTLRRASRHAVSRKHLRHGPDRSGSHPVPPLASLRAISAGKGRLFGAAAAGGILLKCICDEEIQSCLSMKHSGLMHVRMYMQLTRFPRSFQWICFFPTKLSNFENIGHNLPIQKYFDCFNV